MNQKICIFLCQPIKNQFFIYLNIKNRMKKFLLSAFTVAAALSANAAYTDFPALVYFPLDNVTGTTLTNAAGAAAELVDGSAAGLKAIEGLNGAKAVECDGTTYYHLPASDVTKLGDKDLTFEFLFKSTNADIEDATNLKGYVVLLGWNADENDGVHNGDWMGIEFQRNEGKAPNLAFASKAAGKKRETGYDFTEYVDGEWHHACLVRDQMNDGLSIWIDGNSLASRSTSHDLNTLTGLYFLANPTPSVLEGTKPFSGGIDEFKMLDGALSMDDITERYEALTSGAGINDIVADMEGGVATVYTVAGVKVAEGTGDVEALVQGLDKDLYVVVITNGVERKVQKVIVK